MRVPGCDNLTDERAQLCARCLSMGMQSDLRANMRFSNHVAHEFAQWADALPGAPLLCGHHDADGLSALALLARAWERKFGERPPLRIVGRGENAWTKEFADTLADGLHGLVLLDLGTGERKPTDASLCVIDHHVPTSEASDRLVLSGYGETPVPSTSLIAWWAAKGLIGDDADDLLWLAYVGAMGDMADTGFDVLDAAKKRYKVGRTREVVSLVNAPRRSASGDAAPALEWLLAASDPQDALSGDYPARAVCEAAREEVKAATAEARRAPPRFGSVYGSDVAIIRVDTPCQVHPLIAQSWAGRLKPAICFAANAAIEPGRVSFSGRTRGEDKDIIAFLAEHAPENADRTRYGNGHRKAAGGSLPAAQWNAWVESLGFDERLKVEV